MSFPIGGRAPASSDTKATYYQGGGGATAKVVAPVSPPPVRRDPHRPPVQNHDAPESCGVVARQRVGTLILFVCPIALLSLQNDVFKIIFLKVSSLRVQSGRSCVYHM